MMGGNHTMLSRRAYGVLEQVRWCSAVFVWELRVANVLGLDCEGGEGGEKGGEVTTGRCSFPFIYYDPHA